MHGIENPHRTAATPRGEAAGEVSDILAALDYARLPSGDPVPDSPQLRCIYTLIDVEAERVGAKMAETRDLYDLLSRTGSLWLRSFNRDIAQALATDPRLAALPVLAEWAKSGRAGGISGTHVNWYGVLLWAAVAR